MGNSGFMWFYRQVRPYIQGRNNSNLTQTIPKNGKKWQKSNAFFESRIIMIGKQGNYWPISLINPHAKSVYIYIYEYQKEL